MADAPKTGKSQGPIPVSEIVRRLIERQPGAASTIRAPRARAPFPPVIPNYGAVLTGKLESHGAGSPPHRMGQASYFVKLLTTDGLKTLWGADLKRAIEESETRPKIHSRVGVQRIGYQILKVPTKEGDKKDGVNTDWKPVRRTRWRIEDVEFFADRVRQARQARESRFRGRAGTQPPLPHKQVSAGMVLAQIFADRHIHSPHDRERFLEQVKNRLLLSALNVTSERLSQPKDYEPPTR